MTSFNGYHILFFFDAKYYIFCQNMFNNFNIYKYINLFRKQQHDDISAISCSIPLTQCPLSTIE